jgi:hypothetical protein
MDRWLKTGRLKGKEITKQDQLDRIKKTDTAESNSVIRDRL